MLLYVSSYCYMCPPAAIYVSICILILLYMCPHTTLCVLLLLCACPHTICILILLCVCPHNTTYVSHAAIYVSSYYSVSSYCHICVLILLSVSSYHSTCVLMLLYIGERDSRPLLLLYYCYTTAYIYMYVYSVSSYHKTCVFMLLYMLIYMCPHTNIHVSSNCYICVLILLDMRLHATIFVSCPTCTATRARELVV